MTTTETNYGQTEPVGSQEHEEGSGLVKKVDVQPDCMSGCPEIPPADETTPAE